MSHSHASQGLLAWYRRSKRALPWRLNADPYRVWVSEIMLQQTRVEVVIPYYEPFLQRFPDLKSLANASLPEVLAAWSGLGYYRRARLLHRAAQALIAQGGKFPESSAALQNLPGIGPYTAAALASIAFGETVAAIDGNVERVLARCLALEQDPRRGEGRKRIAARAAGLVKSGSPGDSNQALMELGATVCTPRNPKCECCPLEQGCLGAAGGQPESYPVRRQRPSTRDVRLVVAVAQRGREVLLFCRPEESGQLAGLWELPWVEWCGRSRAERRLGERFGGSWSLGPSRGRVSHTITDRRLRLEVHVASRVIDPSAQDVREGPEGGWFPLAEIERLPTSSQVSKVLEVILGRP